MRLIGRAVHKTKPRPLGLGARTSSPKLPSRQAWCVKLGSHYPGCVKPFALSLYATASLSPGSSSRELRLRGHERALMPGGVPLRRWLSWDVPGT